MNENSSTKMGDKLEDKVYNIISGELEQNRLFVKKENCKMYRKKGYYSKDRQKNIIFDISIEVFLPEATEYSMLIIFECKNYNHLVPVDDIEEFFTKLQQISGANVKGIVVSSNSFQEGAFNFSKSKGIGLIRLFDNSKFKWILKRAITGLINYNQLEKTLSNIYTAMTLENYISNDIDFFGYYSGNFTNSARQLFKFFLKDYLDTIEQNKAKSIIIEDSVLSSFVPFVPKDKIEKICTDLLQSINYKDGVVSIEKILNKIEQSDDLKIFYEPTLGYDELGFEILGKISFSPTSIYISKRANENQYREKFTITHELGHYFLNHHQYIYSEFYGENDYESNNLDLMNIEDIKKLEWQANYFSSCLLLPKDNFIKEFYRIAHYEDIRDKGHGPLYVDHQTCNINNYYIITNKLKQKFEVSRKAISIKLKDLGLLNDKTGLFS